MGRRPCSAVALPIYWRLVLRYLWGQQRQCSEQHYSRRHHLPRVLSLGKLLCLSVVQTLSSDRYMYNPLLCYRLYATVEADAVRSLLYSVGGPILYCATSPLHYCWGRCCPFCIRLAARSSTVLPPPTLLFGQTLPFFYVWLAARSSTVLPPCTRVGRPFTVLPPYTARRLNAACFGAMRASAVWSTLSCVSPVNCTWGICCQLFCDEHQRVGRTLVVLPRTMHLC